MTDPARVRITVSPALIAVAITVLMQLGAGIWAASALSNEQENHARRIISIEDEQSHALEIRDSALERLTRLEEKLDAATARGEQYRIENRERVGRLEQQLDQVLSILREQHRDPPPSSWSR